MAATSGTDEPVSGELVSVAHALSLPAESYGNDPDIEMAWAMRAMQHAEVYYKVSCLSSSLSRIKHVIIVYDALLITILSKLNSCVLEIVFINVSSYPQTTEERRQICFYNEFCCFAQRYNAN
ncbi:chromosome X open reading frame 26, isoform CRA_d [Homo sapiens]|nr:chromosome X open reading frame 26, isoform CRA_d [Homo sapiens]